ncbi:tryptophan-rich sensory protein [Donghicola sp. C2-DW-16]|uniref:Tryptophan-rich sensory protein n=1 Tax=Donghicola mangrovi TaxID=2729614 RepID=A0ABX2PDU5_9RHOB|nr:TspO/MBR family protein [Donghicola mangrovi]NVO26987.1 tryptophan-rich sensory protein [Donghicola mangrovi]
MDWTVFIILLCATGAAAATGVLFQPGEWYISLKKPSFTPPNWAFPVVWTTLYILMALAGARAVAAGGPLLGQGMALWGLQIALNTLWTPVFFGAHRIRVGMLIISLMWVVIGATTVTLWQIDWIAGLMFLPYWAWVSVAAALNGSIWRNNPDRLRG